MIELDTIAETILALFRAGSDTLEIAVAMRMPEAAISRLLWVARSRERRIAA